MKPIFISVTFAPSSSVWTGILGGCPKGFYLAGTQEAGALIHGPKVGDHAGEIERPESARKMAQLTYSVEILGLQVIQTVSIAPLKLSLC